MMFDELQRTHHHFTYSPAERERLSRVVEGLEPAQPDDKFKQGKLPALQWYGLRLAGAHSLALHPWRNPDFRVAVGDILMTLLAISNVQNIKLDEQELPEYETTDWRSFAEATGPFHKGAEDLDHADPTAFLSMRQGTLQLAGWVKSAATHLQTPLSVLLEEAHARSRPTVPPEPPTLFSRLGAAARALAGRLSPAGPTTKPA